MYSYVLCEHTYTHIISSFVEKPNITYVSCNQEVNINSSTTFHCNATGHARTSPKIVWYRVNNGLLSRISQNDRHNISSLDTCKTYADNNSDDQCVLWSTLTILHTHFHDTGCYKCGVTYHDGIPVDSKIIILTVLCK